MPFRAPATTAVPATPRVISPSPTPSDRLSDSYSGPTTRSAAKRAHTPQAVDEISDEDDYFSQDRRRPRTRSRSPVSLHRLTPLKKKNANGSAKQPGGGKGKKAGAGTASSAGDTANGKAAEPNGHLAPPSAGSPGLWGWRDFSRSPSPLGLIPIHRHWRTFVHKHEVPRKLLHVSIGFISLWLYVAGVQTGQVAPWLMTLLVPIATVDFLRLHYPGFNRFYVMVLGALMRESEVAGWNGVVFYLLGAFLVLFCFPKDVGMMGVLLLSWCDTAASTFGRLYGRYTPRIRRGKSLAGSLAAFVVGVATSAFFWGWLAPRTGPFPGDEHYPFMFTGVLRLPAAAAAAVGLDAAKAYIAGPLALGVMSIWSGFAAAASEVVDVFGWDDNLTIPVLSGVGIWGFLKVFG